MRRQRGRAADRSSDASLAELERFYAEVDALYADTSCAATTECCRFGITGREPYVTSLELALVERALAQKGGIRIKQAAPLHERDKQLPMLADERTCPLLAADSRCSIYKVRPFGCRTFFCDRATSLSPVKHSDMLERVRTLKQLAERHQAGGSAGRPLTRALTLARSRRD